jgi:hypothetical protein
MGDEAEKQVNSVSEPGEGRGDPSEFARREKTHP